MKRILLTPEKMMKASQAATNYEFELTDWYPTIEELEEKIDLNDVGNVPFLLWLCNTDLELSRDEIATKEYIKQHLAKLLTMEGEKEE